MTIQNPFGRVTEDGTVFVLTAEGEKSVGQYTIGTPAEGLDFFVKKFDILLAEADLTLERLKGGRANAESAREVAARLQAQLTEPTCVGDLKVFEARATELLSLAEIKHAERQAAKAAAREAALARRIAIADEAEKLATSTAWKQTQERFASLLEEWKTLARGDRDAEQMQWKRFSQARQNFDRARRTHFAEASKVAAAAKSQKADLVARAQGLSTSTEWTATTQAFRDLMDQWKAAPRGAKKDDDALWTKFRAAQQAFFDAKSAAMSERDEEFKANLELKLALLTEAEALLPISDHKAAKAALRAIGARWDKIGHVPRADISRVEGRLRKVEEAIAEAEKEEWRRTDPSRKAFAANTASKFQEAVDKLEAELATAKAAGSPKVADIEKQLVNARALVEAVIKHA